MVMAYPPIPLPADKGTLAQQHLTMSNEEAKYIHQAIEEHLRRGNLDEPGTNLTLSIPQNIRRY